MFRSFKHKKTQSLFFQTTDGHLGKFLGSWARRIIVLYLKVITGCCISLGHSAHFYLEFKRRFSKTHIIYNCSKNIIWAYTPFSH